MTTSTWLKDARPPLPSASTSGAANLRASEVGPRCERSVHCSCSSLGALGVGTGLRLARGTRLLLLRQNEVDQPPARWRVGIGGDDAEPNRGEIGTLEASTEMKVPNQTAHWFAYRGPIAVRRIQCFYTQLERDSSLWYNEELVEVVSQWT